MNARRSAPWLVVAGVLVAAVSMRGPILAVTPVLRDIERDLSIASSTAGLLTTAPVLMFAALTPLAAVAIRRAGAEIALMASLGGVLIGTFVRALPGFGWMLAGMLVIGAAITIGNVVIPVIIRREVVPPRVALVTAAYAATVNVGSLLTSLLTAPLAEVVGWNAALLVWSSLTLAGILLWGAHMRRAGTGDRFSGQSVPARGGGDAASAGGSVDPETITGPLPVIDGGGRSMLRRPVTWLLVGAFAVQTTMYYALSTWLPTLAADELGLERSAAGAVASLYQGAGILGAFVVPLLARFTPRFVAPSVICASWLVLTIGLLAAPELLWVWLSFGAIGHAGGFVVIFAALVEVSRSDREAAGMSALVQGSGYVVAASGGPMMGAVFQLTGGWDVPLTVVLVMSAVYCSLLLGAVAAARRATA
ncbi:MFS transporter [Microbacterium sp. ARD31]|uniref:MFS transporter n=1 Tax=Microbacterium sp. ARD31 TaxID=2962576 RepID=UPI002882B72B|nr:MFS transporter [Microbacterium sp. ARD31]MDT0184155.1 MFS transporter [Microbacterium sp. ARD31]